MTITDDGNRSEETTIEGTCFEVVEVLKFLRSEEESLERSIEIKAGKMLAERLQEEFEKRMKENIISP